MKKVFLVFGLVLISALVFGQDHPTMIRYPTFVQDASGTPMRGAKTGIQISIIQGSKTGTVVYCETQSPTSDARGMADLLVGTGTVVSGDFGSIDWANGPYWIKTEINAEGGPVFKNSGTLLATYGLLPQNIVRDIPDKHPNPKAPGMKHYVGEFYGGGIVFYVTKDTGKVEHGLIVGLADLSSACVWSNVTLTLIGPDAESMTNGKANTKAIVEQEGHKRSAALLCDSSTANNDSDWYLPSMQELNVLWNNLYIINKALNNDGNPETTPLAQAAYWTSTEDEATTFAWYFGMYDAGPDGNTGGTSDKGELHYVRAIRAF